MFCIWRVQEQVAIDKPNDVPVTRSRRIFTGGMSPSPANWERFKQKTLRLRSQSINKNKASESASPDTKGLFSGSEDSPEDDSDNDPDYKKTASDDSDDDSETSDDPPDAAAAAVHPPDTAGDAKGASGDAKGDERVGVCLCSVSVF